MGTGSTAPRAGQRLLRSGRWLRAVADIGAMSSGCAVLLAARRHPRDFARHHRTGIGPEMTDEQRMLADMAGAIFGAYGEANATIADWHEIEASGMTTLMVRSEEHTSELQSLMRISYAVFCLKKKKQQDRIQ